VNTNDYAVVLGGVLGALLEDKLKEQALHQDIVNMLVTDLSQSEFMYLALKDNADVDSLLKAVTKNKKTMY
jgi:uncharacterized membrane protein YqgA involved in biofilm formation